MTVSIIVPSFNNGRYLSAALRSAIALDWSGEREIVVIDDGSNDGTDELREQFNGRDGIVWLRHDVNRGKLGALNTAAGVIAGDYVVVLDADDELLPTYLTECLNAVRTLAADFAYSGCDLIDEAGQPLAEGRSMPFDPALIEGYSFIPDCALTSREAFRSVLPLDETVRKLPKHHRWKRICANGYRGTYLDRSLFRYRMHDANMSGIGRTIKGELAAGRNEHRMLNAYWEVSAAAAESHRIPGLAQA